MTSSVFRAHLSLTAATLIFGANYWISKSLMPGYLSPSQLVFIRVISSVIIAGMIGFFVPGEKINPQDHRKLMVASFFGVTLNQLLFFIGLNLSTPVDVSIIHVTNPVFVMIIAALWIQERITLVKATGILLGVSGAVLLIVTHGDLSFHSAHLMGNLSALCNTLAYAIYLVLIKPLMKRYSPFTIMKWLFLYGTFTTVPLTIKDTLVVNFHTFGLFQWFSLIYVVIFNTFVAYLLTIYALKQVSTAVVSYYIYFQPVIVSIIALILGKQIISWIHLTASAMIFLGVYLVSSGNGPVSPHLSSSETGEKSPA